jgi:hypothetical protein
MTGSTHQPLPTPANENNDPLRRAATALDALYRWRGQLLDRDLSQFTLEQWRRHRKALQSVDKAISRVLPYV